MEFDSPDVERDFPGLYASEGADGKSKKSKEDSDYSDGEHDKVSKKNLLIGTRKDKKDKGKDRGYAALEGESSPEEDIDAKSPGKSKKAKSFKFTSSKSKEKREKSREKEKDKKEKKEEEKPKEKEKVEKEKEHKKKDKDRKEKDKKEKFRDKEKDKKDKKTKQSSSVSEEVLELGDIQPVFGVSISLATERSRCHDGIDLPLVVRDCIDYLQEYGIRNEQIYKVEPLKTRLQSYKRLYNNRERQPETDILDIPTACGLLKLFLRELPEPVLTTDLIARFEEVASHPQVTKQQQELQTLIEQLPSCNKNLLAWILLHFDAVIQNEKFNKMNAQSLAMLLSPPLQMSHRLLIALLCHCPILFGEMKLIKYVPPITSSSPKLPESADEIQAELRKQESLLAQIHSEMNAGFASKKREEQLWEVQRIITQLKRKLRSFEKKLDKSIDDTHSHLSNNEINEQKSLSVNTGTGKQKKLSCSDDESIKTTGTLPSTESAGTNDAKNTPQQEASETNNQSVISMEEKTKRIEHQLDGNNADGIYVDEDTGFLMVSKDHPDYLSLIKLQLENQELLSWKAQLQARISSERAEILRLKHLHQQQEGATTPAKKNCIANEDNVADGEYEKIIENYVRENNLLEHKKNMLAKEIFDERRACIALQVELALQQF